MTKSTQSEGASQLADLTVRLKRLESAIDHILLFADPEYVIIKGNLFARLSPRSIPLVSEGKEDIQIPVEGYNYLAIRPSSGRRQAYLKDRKMTVRQLVGAIKADKMVPEEAAEHLDLPVEAILEALRYFEKNRALIEYETARENYFLELRGYPIATQPVSG